MIVHISDTGDPRVADYAHVGDPVWLAARGLFVAEGRLVVQRLLESGAFDLHSVIVTPAALSGLGAGIDAAASPVYVCGQRELNTIAGFNFHRGCLALARRPPARSLDALAEARLLVALEGIANPDNVGGIFRSALAFGAGGVVLDAASADPLYRKSIRTSMAAALQVPFAQVHDFVAALGTLRAAGFRVLAFTPRPDARDLADVHADGASQIVLLFGAEGDGLSAATLAASSEAVRIPIDPRSDSLNVAVAAAIALHRFSAA